VGSCRGVTEFSAKLELASQGLAEGGAGWELLLLASWLSDAAAQMAGVADIIREGGGDYEAEAREAQGLVARVEAVLESVAPEIPDLIDVEASSKGGALTEIGAQAAAHGIAAT